jgi:3-keto-5-aminohexanoate cleavage enzyme
MARTWIEAGLNGPWGREHRPRIPITVEEIIAEGLAAAGEGAAIVHVHPYDPATGRQKDDWQIYARIIEGIRAHCDAIVYPTAGVGWEGGLDARAAARARFSQIEELARRGLIEMTNLDPGSVNVFRLEKIGGPDPGFVYQNPPELLEEGYRVTSAHRVRPNCAVYEPGFTRTGTAYAKATPGLLTPVYRFMFSDRFAWGFPPRLQYLDAHLTLFEECAPGVPWMIGGLDVDIFPLLPAAVACGGHVRVGLEDAPWGSALTNRQCVATAVKLIRENSSEPASPAEVRADLAEIDAQWMRARCRGQEP